MPGVMSSAGKELAEPLTKKIVSRFSCFVWVFFWFSPSPSLSWVLGRPGIKLCVNAIAPQSREPVLPGPV